MTWRGYGKVGEEGDVGGEGEQRKSSSRLIFFSQSGSIIDFLDEFEKVLSKMPMHLFKLQRAKLSSRQLAQNMRPGMLLRNVDFGENYTIKSPREVSDPSHIVSFPFGPSRTSDRSHRIPPSPAYIVAPSSPGPGTTLGVCAVHAVHQHCCLARRPILGCYD